MTGHIIDYFRRRAEKLRKQSTPPIDSSCTFCAIVAGDGPSFKVYEDDNVMAFLDIMPISPGHTLVIPKAHYPRVSQLPEELSALVGSVLPKISRAICAATDQPDFNIVSNQGHAQVVDHVHYHLVPAPKRSEGLGWAKASSFDRRRRTILEDQEGETMSNLIRSKLEPTSML